METMTGQREKTYVLWYGTVILAGDLVESSDIDTAKSFIDITPGCTLWENYKSKYTCVHHNDNNVITDEQSDINHKWAEYKWKSLIGEPA